MISLATAAALAAGLVAPAGSAPGDEVAFRFDWPLDCPVEVTQTYVGTEAAIDAVTVTYEATATAGEDVVVVEFTDAVVADGGDVDPELEPQLAAFFTNPLIEVEPDGSPIEAIGFEEWFEDFTAAGALGDEAQLEQEVVHRTASVVWAAWAGLWVDVGAVAGNERIDDVTYLDEGLDERTADVDVVVEAGDDDTVELVAERTGDSRTATFTARGDPSSLVLTEAGYEVADGDGLIAAYEWSFAWPDDCDGPTTAQIDAAPPTEATAATGGREVVVPPGFTTIGVDELPPEARDTLALIDDGGPFPYRQDGAVFENREGILPERPHGYYREYTVETPGSDDRGARRIVTGEGGEVFYTDDHYDSFRVVVP